MACACKNSTSAQAASVKQVVKKIHKAKPVTTNKKVATIRKVSYRRPM